MYKDMPGILERLYRGPWTPERRPVSAVAPANNVAGALVVGNELAPVLPHTVPPAQRGRDYELMFQGRGQKYGLQPAWQEPPQGNQDFTVPGVIVTPAAAGAVTPILQFQCPPGYDGIIKRVSHNWTGGGFVQGSGNLIWRMIIDGRAVRNYENILVEFGTPAVPRELCAGIPLKGGQTFIYAVIHVVGSPLVPAGTFTIAFAAGWFYPQEAS